MNGKERAVCALSGKAPDQTPVFAGTLAHATWMNRVPQGRFHQDSKVLSDCIISATRTLELDGIYVSSDNWILYEALGGEVFFPDDDEPWGKNILIEKWNDLAGLQIPSPANAGRMPMMLEAAHRVVGLAGNDLYVEANIDSGPFQLAITLRGPQTGLLDLHDNPRELHKLLEFTTEVAIAYGKAMAQTGVHGIQFGESGASLISADLFEEFALPYIRRVIAALQGSGVDVFLHVCGDSRHLLDALERCKADCVEIDSTVDLSDAFGAFGSKSCVRGNVDTSLLLSGPSAKIIEAAEACIAKARRASGRLILSPGCGVPKHTPPKHVQALVAAAKKGAEQR